MQRRHSMKFVTIILLIGLTALLAFSAVSAFQGNAGELISGQPSFGNIPTAGGRINYTYNLGATRTVTLQVIGEVAQPTITILQNGQPVATQPNAAGSNIVSLTALLNAGSYLVEISTVNNTSGSVIVVVQSETPVSTGQLPIASIVGGQVTTDTPTTTYNFTALPEPAFLYFESSQPIGGPNILLRNTTTGTETTINGVDISGTRFRIPAGAAAYEIQLAYTGTGEPQPFTLCLTLVSASSCESGSFSPPPVGDSGVPAVTPEVSAPSGCTVTPLNANGANIRLTGDVASPVVIGLPNGEFASVLGISPNGSFFHVAYKNARGWVAQVAVGSSIGDCSGIPVENPPLFIPTPTPTPIPTHTPTPTPTSSGPCVIKISHDMLVYTQPNAIPDYIFDQVHGGYELIPVGKLSDNSWWKTNYNSSWIQTSHFGHEAHLSGNCNGLQVVSP